MNNTTWMLHHFHDLNVDIDSETVPRWYHEVSNYLHLDDEGVAFEVLSSVVTFGGLSPICPLVRGDSVGVNHDAALRFSIGGIYPTRESALPGEPPSARFAIALLEKELIVAGARFEPTPIIGNMEETGVAEYLYEWDRYTLVEAIEYEVISYANRRIRPPLVEDLFQKKPLYWQVTAIETAAPITLYNSLWSPYRKLQLPALRLFAGPEENCYFSTAYIIVDSRDCAETIQNQVTGLYHAQINCSGVPFSIQRLLDTSIIITDEIDGVLDQSLTIEEVEQKHSNAIVKAVNTLTEFDAKTDAKIAAAMIEAAKDGTDAMHTYFTNHGEPDWPCGSVCATSYEITHPIVQHMIQSGIAFPTGIKVLVRVDGLPFSQSLYPREDAYRAVSETLTRLLGVCFQMYNFYDCDDC
ncbi:hypothetical protein [Pseudomonas mandelii]|uniref:Uncharacterized protein n=1 Tax=Pseudomonas mandelii TaxID=75612 RepID=A0A502IHU2_9PSED|nr:hypothetical protein [Pseudomonas mandelii]TPG84740.1 hypothetical protein EAH74_11990 [Pseudomonas mandelii]